MRIPNKPGEIKQDPSFKNQDGLLHAFAKEIVHGNVILLLGHDSLLRVPSNEEAQTDENLQMLRDCNGSMSKWMASLKTRFIKDERPKEFFVKLFEDERFAAERDIPVLDIEDINPEILRLLKSKKFRIVLTTTFDPLLLQAMEFVWGGKGVVQVKNFGDRDNKDIEGLEKLVLSDDMKPTLYYLFGRATNDVSNYGNPNYIIDEEDYIQMLKDWMVSPPANLISYLSNKRVLAIGCKFENWLFRFFWRAVLEVKQNSEVFKHMLAIALTSSEEDIRLKRIFDLYNLKNRENVDEFLSELNEAILRQNKIALSEDRKEGGIFLSYCSGDYDRVINLFYKLKDLGFIVWMDSKNLHPGDEYKLNISAAIKKCSVFVPVLSRRISDHMLAEDPYNEKDPNFHFYRDFEWSEAVLRKETEDLSKDVRDNDVHRMAIVPFALDDYNPRKGVNPEVRDKYPMIFERSADPYNNAGFVRFIQKLKSQL